MREDLFIYLLFSFIKLPILSPSLSAFKNQVIEERKQKSSSFLPSLVLPASSLLLWYLAFRIYFLTRIRFNFLYLLLFPYLLRGIIIWEAERCYFSSGAVAILTSARPLETRFFAMLESCQIKSLHLLLSLQQGQRCPCLLFHLSQHWQSRVGKDVLD